MVVDRNSIHRARKLMSTLAYYRCSGAPFNGANACPKGSRLSNDVRIRRRASTSGTRRGAKPADHVLASGSHRRMTRLILQPMLT